MAKPSRSDARRGDLDAVHASWTIRSEEDGSVQLAQIALGSFLILRVLVARPCRAGVLNAEPGGGRASGAAQRRRS